MIIKLCSFRQLDLSLDFLYTSRLRTCTSVPHAVARPVATWFRYADQQVAIMHNAICRGNGSIDSMDRINRDKSIDSMDRINRSIR